jgi:hypothetical protein
MTSFNDRFPLFKSAFTSARIFRARVAASRAAARSLALNGESGTAPR